MDSIRKGSGLAIRFPRFTGNYRLDKAAEDATSVSEIVEMYQRQLKKITE
jgi:DNA ligase-1